MNKLSTCATCKKEELAIAHACDKETNEIYCTVCFDDHPCGKGEHGEGCATIIMEGLIT